jgi:hypothetical protein
LLLFLALCNRCTCSGEQLPLPPGVTLPVAVPESEAATAPQENAAPETMPEAAPQEPVAQVVETLRQRRPPARRATPPPQPAGAAETLPPAPPAETAPAPAVAVETAIPPETPAETGTPPETPVETAPAPAAAVETAIPPEPPVETAPAPALPAQADTVAAPATPPAARRLRWEFGVYGTAGPSQLLATMQAGAMRADRLHGSGGADITFFFSPRWGLTAGIEIASAGARLSTTEVQQGNNFTSVLVKQEETLAATFLHIPLTAQFRWPAGRHFVYAAAGAKLDFALGGSYRATGSRRSGTAVAALNTSGTLRFGHGASLLAETGVRWTLRRKWGIYTGIYAACGLLDIRPEAGEADAGKLGESSLLFVRRANGEPYVDAIRLFAAGVTVKLKIGTTDYTD